MNLQMLIIILIIAAAVGLFLLGRELFQRGVRMKNRLQMSAVYTNITHELLTPLTVISASVDRLREQEPSYSQDYDLMQLNIERMVRLLQQILETSKSQSGELKLLLAQGDIMQYIQKTALCIEPLMAKKGLDFTIKCTPESMMGWIDTDKLDKIIYNLLSNAAKYTQGDTGKVALQVNTNKKYDHIIIKVRDNGIGIPQEKMKKLFHRFYDGDYLEHFTEYASQMTGIEHVPSTCPCCHPIQSNPIQSNPTHPISYHPFHSTNPTQLIPPTPSPGKNRIQKFRHDLCKN